MIYYTYDYDRSEIVRWNREGECRRCGDCCRAVVGLITVKPQFSDVCGVVGSVTDGRGVWAVVDDGAEKRAYKLVETPGWARAVVCCSLGDDGLCKEYGSPDRLDVCPLWPFSPQCVDMFPGCGYSFREVGRWSMEDREQ